MPSYICIDQLTVYTVIGINEHEKHSRQPLLISARFSADFTEVAASDNILHTIDYDQVCKTIQSITENTKNLLIESLLIEIQSELLSKFNMTDLWLRIEKPNAIPNTKTIAVETSYPK